MATCSLCLAAAVARSRWVGARGRAEQVPLPASIAVQRMSTRPPLSFHVPLGTSRELTYFCLHQGLSLNLLPDTGPRL